MNRLKYIILIIIICPFLLVAQASKNNWLPVSVDENKSTFINITGLSLQTEEELNIWVLREMNTSYSIEEINGSISKTKTNYIINKELGRFSIVEIIFYDEDDNVLKNYRYSNQHEVKEYKYSYPILNNSEMEAVYNKCIEIIKSSDK